MQGDRDKIASLIEVAMQNITGPVSPSQALPTLSFPPQMPPQQVSVMVNSAPSLGAINAALTQVPMHSTS